MSNVFAQEYVFQRHNIKAKITEINMVPFIVGLLDFIQKKLKKFVYLNSITLIVNRIT